MAKKQIPKTSYDVIVNKDLTLHVTKTRFTLNTIKADERCMIFGFTGTGKSFLAEKIARFLGRKKLVVVLDTKNEYQFPILQLNHLTNPKQKGVFRTYEIDFDGQIIEDNYVIAEFLATNLFNRGNCVFFIEEIGDVVPKSSKNLYELAPKIAKYIQQGRARKCAFIGTSQRPAEVHTTITSQSNHIISFKMSLPHDIKYLERYFPKQIWLKINKDYEFLRYYVNDQRTYHHYKMYA